MREGDFIPNIIPEETAPEKIIPEKLKKMRLDIISMHGGPENSPAEAYFNKRVMDTFSGYQKHLDAGHKNFNAPTGAYYGYDYEKGIWEVGAHFQVGRPQFSKGEEWPLLPEELEKLNVIVKGKDSSGEVAPNN